MDRVIAHSTTASGRRSGHCGLAMFSIPETPITLTIKCARCGDVTARVKAMLAGKIRSYA